MCVCACAVCGMCVHLRSHKGDSAEPVCGLIRHRHFPRRAWGQCLWVSLPVCAVFAPVRASLRAPTCTHTHTHTHAHAHCYFLFTPLPSPDAPAPPRSCPSSQQGLCYWGQLSWHGPFRAHCGKHPPRQSRLQRVHLPSPRKLLLLPLLHPRPNQRTLTDESAAGTRINEIYWWCSP